MPAFSVPRRSGPHRVAVIALYRALLSQCRRLPYQGTKRAELLNLVRNRFKQARYDASARRLRVSFEAGYEAIDHLDAAVAGEGESQSYILELLERAPWKAKQASSNAPLRTKKLAEEDTSSAKIVEATSKPTRSIFDRPLPLAELSGKRHVPVLVSANNIPMLRIQKPQPEGLSGYLSHRVRQRQKRHDRKDRLTAELSVAGREDEWDELVSRNRERGVEKAMHTAKEPTWRSALDSEIHVVQGQLAEERRKNKVMAEKMQGVVDRETALFEREKAERLVERERRRAQTLAEGIETPRAGDAAKGEGMDGERS